MAITPTGPSAEVRHRAPHVPHRTRPSALQAACVAGAAVAALGAYAWPAGVMAQNMPGAGAYSLPSPLEGNAQPAAPGSTGKEARQQPFSWRISAEETLTDNVNLEPASVRKSDAVTRIAPGFSVNYRSGRVRVEGDVELPILLYARTGGQNNRIQPLANVTGRLEAVDNLIYVDASAQIQQTYFTPFAPTSTAIENNPQNAYTSYTYHVSPYLRYGSGDYSYLLRDNNIWTNVNSAPTATNNAYTNELVGEVRRNPTPLGWSADYQRNDVQFTEHQSQLVELARFSGLARPDRELELSASVGYENDRFVLEEQSGIIYGAGVRWRPSERLHFDANWEHRVFGPSYRVRLEDRTQLAVWSVEAARQITSYPELLATLPAGSVPTLLDSLFSSRVPDPTERQQFVQQFINARGLPQTLGDPLAIYTTQLHLEEHVGISYGIVGARNSIFLRVYRSRTEPLGSADTTDALLSTALNSTQTGASLTWSHQLQPRMRFSLSYEQRYVKSNDPIDVVSTGNASAHETSLNALLSVLLSTKTRVFGGVRYQRQRTDFGTGGYDESALFAGINYAFH